MRSSGWQKGKHFRAVPSADLFLSHRTGCVPESVASETLKPVVGADSQDCQEKFGRNLSSYKARDV